MKFLEMLLQESTVACCIVAYVTFKVLDFVHELP